MNQNVAEMSITYGALAFGVALVAVMVWFEKRPRKALGPLPVPTTPLMFVGAFICLVALVHIVNVYGIHTGR